MRALDQPDTAAADENTVRKLRRLSIDDLRTLDAIHQKLIGPDDETAATRTPEVAPPYDEPPPSVDPAPAPRPPKPVRAIYERGSQRSRPHVRLMTKKFCALKNY